MKIHLNISWILKNYTLFQAQNMNTYYIYANIIQNSFWFHFRSFKKKIHMYTQSWNIFLEQDMNIVIQIVIRYRKNPSASISRSIIMVRPSRCFSKVPSIRPDFPNWWWYYYRELHEGEKESCPRPNEAVKSLNSSRGSLTCPRNSIESRSIHKNYNNSTESKREILRKV